jgi:hypothetical protein
MLVHRHGKQLDRWMAEVDADDKPHLHSFVTGIRRDYDAMRNALTCPTAPGPSKATSTASK